MPPSRPTIADVAQQAGVSIATVSRVLNGTAPVDSETAQRVRYAIAALNYVPHAAARTLASRRTDTIGLLLPDISGAFFQPMIRGVEAGVNEAGFDLLIHTTLSRSENTPRRTLGEHNTDGLLVFTESLDTKELTRLHGIGFPVVLLHQAPPNSLNIPVVTIENQSGAQKIVEHLINVHNCRRIVFLQGPEGHEDSTWREKGYRLALKAFGIPFDPTLIRRGNFDRSEAQVSLERLLDDGVIFDAVFTGDDESAIGVLTALRKAGRKVPEDIAIVGFDDSIFANTLLPPLTTVRAPTEQVGKQAVQQLVRVIQGEEVEARLVLSTELTIRQSCGCHT
jgi:DNA-binding LacI/PurR family transcriptional regulator